MTLSDAEKREILTLYNCAIRVCKCGAPDKVYRRVSVICAELWNLAHELVVADYQRIQLELASIVLDLPEQAYQRFQFMEPDDDDLGLEVGT